MRVKCYYNKNLKMSRGKLAAQVAHAVRGLCSQVLDESDVLDTIIVLEARKTKFDGFLLEIPKHHEYYIHHDLGKTEVEEGTPTVIAFIISWKENT